MKIEEHIGFVFTNLKPSSISQGAKILIENKIPAFELSFYQKPYFYTLILLTKPRNLCLAIQMQK